MSYKYFYLFLGCGAISVVLLVIDLLSAGTNVGFLTVARGLVPAILFFYLAYKVWHEKNDSELM